MNSTSIVIAVISHKQAHLVENLLVSLKAAEPRSNFHIVVVENMKNQPAVIPGDIGFKVTYLQNETPLSLSENINKAFHYVGGDMQYFCILNPDIIFEGEVYSALISAMNEFHIDIIAPVVVDRSGMVEDSFRPIPTPREIILRCLKLKRLVYNIESLPRAIYPEWIGGMFMLMPSSVFEEVGGFDPIYKLYFEDVDFCLRARQKGLSIGVFTDVHVVHDARRSSHRKVSFFIKHVISAVKFFNSEAYRNRRNS